LIERNQPQDGRLQELERQLEETKADLEFSNASYQDAVNAKDDLNRKARAYKVALDAAQAQVDACGRRVAHAEEQMQRAATSRHDALRQKNEALAAIDCAKNLVTELQERRDEQQAIVDEFANAARTIASDRVPVDPGMNPHRLNTKIESLLRDLEKAEKAAGGTSEQLRQAFLQAKLEYTLAEEQFLSMKNVESVSCIFNFCGGSPTDASRRRLRKHWIIDVQDGSGSEDSSHSERAACFAIFSVNATSAVISDSITAKKYLQSM
jgi:chromosome segregation ATPase